MWGTNTPMPSLGGWSLSIVLLAAAFFASPTLAQPETGATTVTALNLRTGPGTQYPVVTVIPGGASVTVFQCTTAQSWCELGYAGRVGWGSARYLNFGGGAVSGAPPQPPVPGGTVQAVTTVQLNMRLGPAPTYPVVRTVPAGVTVPVYRCIEDYLWCEILYAGSTGWVAASYLRATAPQYAEQPLPNVGAQLGLRIFEFILGQIGAQMPQQPVPPRAPGPNEVCLYRDANFGGQAFCARMGQSDDSLGDGWNDVISSIRVGAGAFVQVCQNVGFGGTCRTFTQDIPQLPGVLNDRISSFRTTQGGGGPAPGPTGRACFYADWYYQGAAFCLNVGQSISALTLDWNDRISSIRIDPGVTVQVCEAPNFAGWCEQFTADVPQLPGIRNEAITSIRVR